jgi:GH15 family glucan-1,4-alpha-glucosidase
LTRDGGYADLRSYAAIGDGRSLALVAADGSIDWLCAPAFDDPSVFGALLDAERGGRFALAPSGPFESERRYVERTNVLETTFRSADGVVRTTDALVSTGPGALARTVVRRVECLAGRPEIGWSIAPRPGYGLVEPAVEPAPSGATITGGGLQLRAAAFALGEAVADERGLHGTVRLDVGARGLLAVSACRERPAEIARDALEDLLDADVARWRAWTARLAYRGPWRPLVERSALVLKLLTDVDSGAIVAAPTTSLPESPAGTRTWDYRYSWVRDGLLVLDAFFGLGSTDEATAYFGWLRDRIDVASGEVRVAFDLRGGPVPAERELPLHGWRGARPVRVGNHAAGQFQASTYGALLHACHLYVARAHGGLPVAQLRAVLAAAEHLAEVWRLPDAGMWEERGPERQHTHSKMLAALGLHCAADLAGAHMPELEALLARECDRAVSYVGAHCVDAATNSWTRLAGQTAWDASLLLPIAMGFGRFGGDERAGRTVDEIRARLGGDGALLRRYLLDDGLPDEEGWFLPCSAWLVAALARLGRVDEAAVALDELAGLANDVGLFSEELAEGDGAFLGNLPQALTHASMISAATAVEDALRS